jgi:hypothetical protein
VRIYNIDLEKIRIDVMDNHFKPILDKLNIPLSEIKRVAESDIAKKAKRWKNPDLDIGRKFGFRWQDVESQFIDKKVEIIGLDKANKDELKEIMNKKYMELSWEEKNILKKVKISAYDIINVFSGGHKNIQNISGWNYITYTPKGEEDNLGLKYMKAFGRKIFADLKKLKTAKEPA